MKYALGKSRTRRPSRAPGDDPLAEAHTGSELPVEGPIRSPDPRSLALALDRLTQEVLQSHRPPEDAWEQLRREVVPQSRR